MWKDLQQKVKIHQIVSPFECRTAVIFQALIPTLNAFQTSVFINLWIWIWESVLQTMQCLLSHWWIESCFFWCNICWSKKLPLFAVSDRPFCKLDKYWSSLEAVRGFKVEDQFPSKSVRRNSMKEFQNFWWRLPLFRLVKSRLGKRMWWPYFAHWKESPYANIGIGMSVFIVNVPHLESIVLYQIPLPHSHW